MKNRGESSSLLYEEKGGVKLPAMKNRGESSSPFSLKYSSKIKPGAKVEVIYSTQILVQYTVYMGIDNLIKPPPNTHTHTPTHTHTHPPNPNREILLKRVV